MSSNQITLQAFPEARTSRDSSSSKFVQIRESWHITFGVGRKRQLLADHVDWLGMNMTHFRPRSRSQLQSFQPQCSCSGDFTCKEGPDTSSLNTSQAHKRSASAAAWGWIATQSQRNTVFSLPAGNWTCPKSLRGAWAPYPWSWA